jgi:dihydroorotate dehydrogenase electron transfer subunit
LKTEEPPFSIFNFQFSIHMAQQRQLEIADQRSVTARLRWLTLHTPELARAARAGQYLLVRCAEQGSYDPLLRRPLFIAAAEPALGQIGLLYEPSERGLLWLSRGRAGDTLDVLGPLGHPFELEGRTRNLLLVGAGPGLAALLLLARQGAAGGAVTLIAGASESDRLPPPFLLPGEVEYQTVPGLQIADFRLQIEASGAQSAIYNLQSAITWADQICAALPSDQLLALREAIKRVKYRWERGFASALLEGPLVCGVGACGVCTIEMRRGTRMLCSDGPVFDLRDVGDAL